MPDLLVVGQPERALRAGDNATQVAHVKRAAPVVEVGIGRDGVNKLTFNIPQQYNRVVVSCSNVQ